ncbi:MAG TPA: ABC transporter substrate-binding protein, partial [Gaiellaceae bacterium]|nr:ABC transporter substrate-binding protein [Gaiellaceae bacterium]
MLATALLAAPAARAATYTVTTTADAGAGSLRQAILDSNGSIGIADTIDFNLVGAGPHVIQPVTVLPQVTDPVTIDGSAELSGGWPLVTIDGGPVSAPSLYGLDVQPVAFGATQIRALAFTRWDTGNGAGLRLAGSGTSTVFGNLFGLDAAGAPLGNYAGISVEGNMGSNIGGTAAGTRNVISGNTTGVSLASSTASSNVSGNWIGVGLDGSSALGNSLQGVLAQAGNHQVGFTTAPSANRIKHNGTGVRVTSGSTVVRGNEIDQNVALGIDLGLDGVTPNDPGDPDSGPNNLQNYPTGLTASLAGGQIQISGTLDSIGDTTYTLHFYSSEAADPSGHGEGARYLGSAATGTGSFSHTFTPIVPVADGDFITATATDPGVLFGGPNTSEFSAAVVAADPSSSAATVGIDADPPCLNPLLAACTFAPGQWIAATALAGAFRVLPNSSFEPVVVEGVDVETAPFRLTYRIKEQAVWSDGTPLTADDFAFTLDTILDPANSIASRAGYELVTEAQVIDAQTFRVTFSAPYPDWRSLFPVVLPEHILSGHDFDQVLQDEIADPVTHEPIGSGPFLLTDRSPGESLTVSRNPRWWGSTVPALQSIVFKVVPSANDQFDGVGNGELDLIFPQPQARIAEIDGIAGIAVQSAPSTTMEHLDFHVQSEDMPLLQQRWFRQAVAYSIDRAALATAAYGSLIPGYPALQNLTFASSQREYRPVFSRYAYNPEAVSALMLGHDCVRGPDDIWSCSGRRASVKIATTEGNQIRELIQQAMVAQAKAAGIELVPDNSPSGVLLGERLPARQYELILFAWVLGGLDQRDLYACAGERNHMGYCSEGLDAVLQDAATQVDAALRAQLINDANRALAEDVPTIPLFRRPAFLVQRETLQGPRINPAGQATWNVEAWNLGTTYVVNSDA